MPGESRRVALDSCIGFGERGISWGEPRIPAHSPMSETFDPSKLLEHQDWIRRLARTLVADPGLAEDLVQDTWVSALRRPPEKLRSARAWLATVLRRHLKQWQRSSARRAEREEMCAREEAQPGVDEVVTKASVHRDLVRFVVALDEPYRTTVLLRFFEGLSYREIAQRQSTTSATVNSRLTRGLDRLRDRVEREARSRGRSRALWIAPLLSDPDLLATTSVGTAAPYLLAGAGLAVVLGAGALWSSRAPAEKVARAWGEAESAATQDRAGSRQDVPSTLRESATLARQPASVEGERTAALPGAATSTLR